MHPHPLSELRNTRYALLRSFRRDGTPVDTPVWFAIDGTTVLFRTKVGPKTKRLLAHPAVELAACDYRGRTHTHVSTIAGRATILAGEDAEWANRILHERYGWQWNLVPLIKIPGVTNVHRDLTLRQKWAHARRRSVWPDSAIVRVDLA